MQRDRAERTGLTVQSYNAPVRQSFTWGVNHEEAWELHIKGLVSSQRLSPLRVRKVKLKGSDDMAGGKMKGQMT